MLHNFKTDIEDITWPRGDTKFVFECWKIFPSERSEWVRYFFQHDKRNFVSPSEHVMFYLLYKHQWNTKPCHLKIVFWCERCVLLCSNSNSDIFHMWRYQVFARKLTWYFIGVYIIKKDTLHYTDNTTTLIQQVFLDVYHVGEVDTIWSGRLPRANL